jgi:hypothetical protein
MARAVKEKADWLTKQEAAKLVGTSEIAQRYLRVTGRRPIAILDPGDVETIRQETIAQIPPPAVEMGSTALTTLPGRGALSLTTLMTAVNAAQVSPALFLTLREASAVSGLTVAYLGRLVKKGELPALKDRGWKVRRADLEKL